MKLLLLTNGLGMGGIETNLVLLAQSFKARGHEVLVAARGGLLAPEVVAAGARHVPLEVRLGRPGAVLRDARALQRLLREERPDVVHVFGASAALLLWLGDPWGLRRRLRRGPPVVASVMGLVNRPDEPRWLVQARTWLTCWGAQRILVISPEIDRHLARLPLRRSRLRRKPVVGVRLPQEGEHAGAPVRVRVALGIPRDHFLVSTVGALAPRKSHEMFLRAAAEVAAQRPDVHFLVAGEGPERAALESEIERLGLRGRARLLGHVPDAGELIAASDVCVRPGVVEGFIGITVLEAQARGVPVVAFETEDVKLAVTHGETGWLVPRGDAGALGAAVLRLLEDPELARSLAKRARAHVEAAWGIDAVAKGLLGLYVEEARRMRT